jgi:hypothetical protein
MLGWLHDVTTQKPVAREVEMWRVRKGDRELRAVAVYLPTGIDLRLLERDDFRRTELCRDGPTLHARAAEWRAKLQDSGWGDR